MNAVSSRRYPSTSNTSFSQPKNQSDKLRWKIPGEHVLPVLAALWGEMDEKSLVAKKGENVRVSVLQNACRHAHTPDIAPPFSVSSFRANLDGLTKLKLIKPGTPCPDNASGGRVKFPTISLVSGWQNRLEAERDRRANRFDRATRNTCKTVSRDAQIKHELEERIRQSKL